MNIPRSLLPLCIILVGAPGLAGCDPPDADFAASDVGVGTTGADDDIEDTDDDDDDSGGEGAGPPGAPRSLGALPETKVCGPTSFQLAERGATHSPPKPCPQAPPKPLAPLARTRS